MRPLQQLAEKTLSIEMRPKGRRTAFYLVLLGAILLVQNTGFSQCDAKVGTVPIQFPVPGEGFVNVGSDGLKQLEINVPNSNRLLCAFLTSDDNARLVSPDQTPVMDRYMMVEVSKDSENSDTSDEEFKKLSDVMRNQFSDVADKVTKPMNDELNEKLKKLNSSEVKIDKPMPLGNFFSHPNAEGFGMVIDYTESTGIRRVAMVAAFLKIRNRLVYVYVYSLYKDPTTIDWLKQKSESWCMSILAANES